MTRDEINRLIQDNELFHGTTKIGVIMDMNHLERLVDLVAAAEREACAELVWPTKQIKTWSEEELAAMTGAFNRAQEKHGWYETIMAVGAAALKGCAAAIRTRGQA